jgi:hypothetical protein
MDWRRTWVHGGPEWHEHRGHGGAWPAHNTPGAGARWRGGQGRAGQGEAGGRLIEAKPAMGPETATASAS